MRSKRQLVATGGKGWRLIGPFSGVLASRTFATGCAPSVPYLFHAKRSKTGRFQGVAKPLATEELSREARGY